MAKLTDEESATLRKLQERQAEAESDAEELEAEKKALEKKHRKALAEGDAPAAAKARDQIENVTVSESSAHALMEALERNSRLLELQLKEKGVSEAKIAEARKGARGVFVK